MPRLHILSTETIDLTSLNRLLLQGLAHGSRHRRRRRRRDWRRLRLLMLKLMVGILPRVLLQLRVELRQHEVGDIDVGPVGRMRGHSRYISVARLTEHVVHAVGEPLPVRQLNLLHDS